MFGLVKEMFIGLLTSQHIKSYKMHVLKESEMYDS